MSFKSHYWWFRVLVQPQHWNQSPVLVLLHLINTFESNLAHYFSFPGIWKFLEIIDICLRGKCENKSIIQNTGFSLFIFETVCWISRPPPPQFCFPLPIIVKCFQSCQCHRRTSQSALVAAQTHLDGCGDINLGEIILNWYALLKIRFQEGCCPSVK